MLLLLALVTDARQKTCLMRIVHHCCGVVSMNKLDLQSVSNNTLLLFLFDTLKHIAANRRRIIFMIWMT